MVTWNISFTNADQFSGTVSSDLLSLVEANIREAGNIWARYLVDNDQQIEIAVTFSDLDALATAGPASSADIGEENGKTLLTSGVLHEISTGTDINDTAADVLMTINVPGSTSASDVTEWFHEPDATNRTGAVPNGVIDAFSLYLHELGHGLGFVGFVSTEAGLSSTPFLLDMDRFTTFENGVPFFTGQNAVALWGGNVPLTENDGSHLGNEAPGAGPELVDDLMYGVLFRGETQEISALDIAILKDLGAPIREATDGDDALFGFDRVSTSVTALNGNDTANLGAGNDTYYALSGDDTIFGEAGDDTIHAGTGNNRIDGGEGTDTAVFDVASSAAATRFQFGSELYLSLTDGANFLIGVENLQFTDGTIAATGTTFDAIQYLLANQDVLQAFGADETAAWNHFIGFGLAEGRSFEFSALEYIAGYADLRAALGANEQAGLDHAINHGINEGRLIIFSGLEYIASFDDLIQAFGADANTGASHFISFGANEGRGVTFDGLQYIASHADLIAAFGTNEEQGASHFISFGADEGRVRDDFDAEQYLANYEDLQNAFGSDTQQATWHYVAFGFNEGRTDDAPVLAALDGGPVEEPFGPDDFLVA